MCTLFSQVVFDPNHGLLYYFRPLTANTDLNFGKIYRTVEEFGKYVGRWKKAGGVKKTSRSDGPEGPEDERRREGDPGKFLIHLEPTIQSGGRRTPTPASGQPHQFRSSKNPYSKLRRKKNIGSNSRNVFCTMTWWSRKKNL
jgi:hypothetical protein